MGEVSGQGYEDFGFAFGTYENAVAFGAHHVANAWVGSRAQFLEAGDLTPQAAQVIEAGSFDDPAGKSLTKKILCKLWDLSVYRSISFFQPFPLRSPLELNNPVYKIVFYDLFMKTINCMYDLGEGSIFIKFSYFSYFHEKSSRFHQKNIISFMKIIKKIYENMKMDPPPRIIFL